eukprot:Filipodium_phascolosomae@DN4583_c0_g1_i1.p1
MNESSLTKPYPQDADKQRRYEVFCKALEGKIMPSIAFNEDEKLGKAQATAEREEFGRVYKLFRMKNPFTEIASDYDYEAELFEAKKYPQRTVIDWVPNRILCKRQRIKDPWDGRPPSNIQTTIHMPPTLEKVVKAGISSILTETPKTETPKTSQPRLISNIQEASSTQNNEMDVTKPSVSEPAGRPDMNIFEAIFGETDDEETEDNIFADL